MVLMRQDSIKYRNKTFDGMDQMSYSIESIQNRAFYTYVLANLNSMSFLLTFFVYITLYTRCREKRAALFSIITLAFFGQFLYFLYHWK